MPEEKPFVIDETAADTFKMLGFKEPFNKVLVENYRRVKQAKDKIHPGRMSVEVLVLIAVMTCRPLSSVKPEKTTEE